MIKFFYDLLVYLTTNYSSMPDSFKKRFSEETLIDARTCFFEVYSCDTYDFSDYE